MVLVVVGLTFSASTRPVIIALGLLLLPVLALRLRGSGHGERAQIHQWRHLASHDSLTGLPNRLTFIDELERSWGRSGEVAVLFIDLDGFKAINDTLGHGVGDEILVEAARRLSTGLRERDVVARFGGDEFVAFLSDCSRGDALDIAERLRDLLSSPYRLGGREVRVSASIGVCPPGSVDAPDQAMRHADIALYSAKDSGRDQVREFDDGLARHASDWTGAAEQMALALSMGDLRLVYQPEIDLETGEVTSVEALLRVDRLGSRCLPLGRLIAAAEDHGLGSELTEWVLNRSLSDAVEWRSLGWNGRVCVNVSGRVLGEGHLAEQVMRQLALHGLAGECLTLEFAEGGLQAGSGLALELLHDIGVTVTLDDFGTGTSSLALLQSFDWDFLKVDRSLVSVESGLAGPLARLGRDLGHVVIAEGIETPAHLAEQRAAGVRRGQGFLLAAPMRPEDVRAVVAVGQVRLPVTG